ncbi:MAG TPA: hypothetical protein VEA59_00315 [Patescibacteria group bacterium]|nr:hypothetical protein [Patescibacteria group bacterium]
MISRNAIGQFSGGIISRMWQALVNAVMFTLKFVFWSAVIVALVWATVSAVRYHTGNYAERATAEAIPMSLDERWEANFKRDVELEMQREGFKAQVEKYATQLAEANVRNAYITKLEQKLK